MNKENLNFKKIEENILNKKMLLEATASWWASKAQLKISELSYLQDKLQNKWDDELAERFNILQLELKHLEQKSHFEQLEIEKLDNEEKNFLKTRDKTIFNELKKKLSEKLNHK